MGFSAIAAAGIGVCVVGLVLGIVSVAIPQWSTLEVLSVEYKYGLWEFCVDSTCTDVELDTLSDEDADSTRAVRAFMIIGIILAAVAAVPAALVMLLKQNNMLYFAAAGVAGGAGLCFMIAFAIYADKLKQDTVDYGASFALCIVAWILNWAAAGVFAAAKVMGKD